jgi:hypothetical protein
VIAVTRLVGRVSDRLSVRPVVAVFFDASLETVNELVETSVALLVDTPETSVDAPLAAAIVVTAFAVVPLGRQGPARTSKEWKAEAKKNERTRRRAISTAINPHKTRNAVDQPAIFRAQAQLYYYSSYKRYLALPPALNSEALFSRSRTPE